MNAQDQIKLMMRLESRFKKIWKKKKEKLFFPSNGVHNYHTSYKTAEEKDVKKGLDMVVDCWLTSMKEEIARLQREDHKNQQLIETKDEKKKG